MKRDRVLLLAALLTLAAAPTATATASTALSGTAYEFNKTDVLLAGATIKVAEDPRLAATTRADGTYELTVPDGKAVTPYIVKPGYHTVHLQTFVPDGEPLERVNFQTPTDAVYGALAALLSVPVDANGNPSQCAIVSTFSTRMVRDLPYAAFTAFGAHGVAGASASASPALPAPVYFNDKVIPDRTQARSSIDGGVIWTGVEAGTYTVRAQHPSTRFATFTATCEPGRVVNANPPWGLHELGRANPTRVSASWSASGAPRRLRLTHLPPKARVTLSCVGDACPKVRTPVPRGRTLDLTRTLAGTRAGQTVGVLVQAQGHDGKLLRWRLRRGTARASTLCVPLGWTKPRRSCASR